MKRLTITLGIFISFLSLLNGQVNRNGNPFIHNYNPSVMDAAERNWSIVQDGRGVMYIGNDDRGILEYDGKTWRKIPVPNNSPVRSLAIDKRNVVYVGAVNELGYLAPDNTGLMQYHSLLDLIGEEDKTFGDVWKTYVINDLIYYQAGRRLFIYDNNSIKLVNNKESLKPSFAFAIEDELYIGSFNKGLMKLGTDTFELVKNGEAFKQNDILLVLTFSESELIVSSPGVFTIYNIKTGEVSKRKISREMISLAEKSIVYHGINLPGNQFAFATLYGGILIMNEKGELIEQYNKNSGLQDDMIAFLYHNQDKGFESPLWAALNSGVSTIEFNSPFRFFSEAAGLKGQPADVIRFNDMLYVATPQDVYYYSEEKNSIPEFIPLDIKWECWSFLEFLPPSEKNSRLLVASSGGIYEIINKRARLIRALQPEDGGFTYAYFLYQSKLNPENLILGLKGGAEIASFKNGSWVNRLRISEVKDDIRSIAEDKEGNLWLATQINGVIRVKKNKDEFIIDRFNEEHGFEILKDIQIFEFDNRLLFATRNGLFKFNESENRFEPDETFGERFTDGSTGIYRFSPDGDDILISGNEGELVGLISKNDQGTYNFIQTPYRRIPKRSTPAIYPDKTGKVWFSNAFDLFTFNKEINRTFTLPYQTLIRKITIGQDSVLFNGTFFRNVEGKNLIAFEQPQEMKSILKYAFNNVTFEFSAPYFENPENIQYSYLLEGFNNAWARWSFENKAVYTNLPEGDYSFKVKAINVHGIESVMGTYAFTIKPPWYRSILAFIVYFILAALFVWGIVVINSRRLKREKIILEGIVRERTAEVVKQKDEIEKQRDMIAEQNKNITDSIEYARRIQTAILPPGDYIKELFPQRFILYLPRDIVSGDFYWLTQKNNQIISVAADCTGHGVPGGFMSMLGIAFLNEIVNKNEVLHANEILNQLREQVISSLHQTGKMGEAQDGMDVSLYILDHKKKKLEFSGANNPLIIIRDNEIIEIKGDKMPIGIHYRAEEPFSNHKVELREGDVVYSFTDGYPDQFGGRKGKKFLSKNFKELLLKIHDKPMNKQRDILEQTLIEWQGSFERVDDILVMGVKI
jgi:serine phosphatase RsbU (regulator of sigma subunit)/ligand-binding sensor domain-containing protein